MSEFIATRVRYQPDEANRQWLSYLHFDGENGYPIIGDSVIVTTDRGVFDGVVEDRDDTNGGIFVYLHAGPIPEMY